MAARPGPGLRSWKRMRSYPGVSGPGSVPSLPAPHVVLPCGQGGRWLPWLGLQSSELQSVRPRPLPPATPRLLEGPGAPSAGDSEGPVPLELLSVAHCRRLWGTPNARGAGPDFHLVLSFVSFLTTTKLGSVMALVP